MDEHDDDFAEGNGKRKKSPKKIKKKIRDKSKGALKRNIEDINEDNQSPIKSSRSRQEPNQDLMQTQTETTKKKKDKEIEKNKTTDADPAENKGSVTVYEGKMGDKIKEDFNYMMLKYAEIFVNNDVLRKEWIASTQKREEDVLRL